MNSFVSTAIQSEQTFAKVNEVLGKGLGECAKFWGKYRISMCHGINFRDADVTVSFENGKSFTSNNLPNLMREIHQEFAQETSRVNRLLLETEKKLLGSDVQ